MQAYEFNSTIENGVIHIPAIYRNRIRPNVKVILLEQGDEKIARKQFAALRLNTKDFKFNREEANER